MEFITIEEALSSVLTLDKQHTREDKLVYRFWIWMAVKQIGCPKASLKNEIIDFNGFTIQKPSDHIYTKDIALISYDGLDYFYKYKGYNNRIHPKTGTNQPSLIEVYEDANFIHLSSNADMIDKIHLSYWAYPVDENGDPLIPSHYLYPVMRFCMMMKAERDGEAVGKGQLLTQEWKIQAAKARGINQMPDVLEARDILKNWVTMLPNMKNLDFNHY